MLSVRWEFKMQDCWIGVFWKRVKIQPMEIKERRVAFSGSAIWQTDIWICIIPMLPIHIVKITPQKGRGG